jgi:hypothetical protein
MAIKSTRHGLWTGRRGNTAFRANGGQQPRFNSGRQRNNYNGYYKKDNPTYAEVASGNRGDRGGPERTNDALASMAAMLKGILLRLTVLEGRGPDSTRQAPSGAKQTSTAGPRSTTDTFNSNNNDFSSVCKVLYRSVQLEHHLSNWKQLPEKLNKRLQSFASDIKPPMTDGLLQNKIKKITDEYAGKLCETVRLHLEERSVLNDVTASTLNNQDVDKASEIAERYINVRLRNKLAHDHKEQLLKQAVKKIGTVQPTAGPSKRTTDDEGFQLQNHRKSRTGGVKRTTTPPSQVMHHNPFSLLNNDKNINLDCTIVDDSDSDNDTDMEPEYEMAQTPKKPRIQQTKTTRRVVIHHEPKDKWAIKTLPSTKVLILGDSNLRGTNEGTLPCRTEVHCLPGAHFDHVDRMFALSEPDDQLDHLVIHVGINHRDEDLQVIKSKFKKLEVTLMNRAKYVSFIGIATPATMDPAMKKRIKDINDDIMARSAHLFAEPILDERASSIRPSDPGEIHYDQQTVNNVIAGICDHLKGVRDSLN